MKVVNKLLTDLKISNHPGREQTATVFRQTPTKSREQTL